MSPATWAAAAAHWMGPRAEQVRASRIQSKQGSDLQLADLL